MTRRTFVITSNQSDIRLRYPIEISKAKVTKLRITPDNITNVQNFVISVSELNQNVLLVGNNHTSYFFLIPFVSNNFALSYTNDQNMSWDYVGVEPRYVNSFTITIYNEFGQLITMNNTNIVIELLIE